MATIGDIQINLTAQTTALEKGLAKGRSQISSFEKDVQKTSLSISNIGNVAGKAIAGFAVANAVAKSSDAIHQFEQGIGPAADRIDAGFKVIGEASKFMGKIVGGTFLGLQGWVLQAHRAFANWQGDTAVVEELDAQIKILHRDMDDLWSGFDRQGFEKQQEEARKAAEAAAAAQQKAIKDTIAQYEKEAQAVGKTATQLADLQLRAMKANEAQMNAAKTAIIMLQNLELEANQRESVLQTIDELRNKLESLGKTEAELAVARAENANATQAQIDRVRGLNDEIAKRQEVIDRLKETARLQEQMAEDGKRVFEATRTPLEKYQQELVRLSALLATEAIDQETFLRAEKDAFNQAFEAMKPPEFVQPASVQKGSQAAFEAIARHNAANNQQDDPQLKKLDQLHQDQLKLIKQGEDIEVAGVPWQGAA